MLSLVRKAAPKELPAAMSRTPRSKFPASKRDVLTSTTSMLLLGSLASRDQALAADEFVTSPSGLKYYDIRFGELVAHAWAGWRGSRMHGYRHLPTAWRLIFHALVDTHTRRRTLRLSLKQAPSQLLLFQITRPCMHAPSLHACTLPHSMQCSHPDL